jgi:hypothetical protein
MGLMGDPSLRLHTVAPASNLTGTVNHTPSSINLNWSASAATDSVLGYYMYRLDTATQVYLRISPSIIPSLTFTDNSPTSGNNYYMVRAVRLEKSASGTYYNLSQGVFDTAFIDLTGINELQVESVKLKVYPNPVVNLVNVQFTLPSEGQVKLTLLNVLGEEMMSLANTELNAGEHTLKVNVSGLSFGIYYFRLQTNNAPDSFGKVVVTGH